jgi:ubiquinone/menaquinone biosynthesis C-methylase UbiE
MLQKFLSSLLGEQARSPKAGTLGGWFVAKMMASSNTAMAVHMVQVLDPKPNAVIVELGPGHGQSLEELFQTKNPSRVYGIEISDSFRAILGSKFAAETAPGGKLSIHEDDAKHLPFIDDNSVDYVLANNVIYFLDPLPVYIDEMKRILKPGGVLQWGVAELASDNDATHFKNTDWDVCLQVMKDAGFVGVEKGEVYDTGRFTCYPLIGVKPPKN